MNELVKLDEYQRALMNAESVEEVGFIRAKVETIAKTIAPRLAIDRFKWAKGYVEACIKHGKMWIACENKSPHGGDKSKLKYLNLVTITDARFKNHTDAMMCARIANLDPDDLDEYFDDCRLNGKFPSLAGAYRIWQLLQPIDECNPLPEGIYSVIYADPPWQYGNVSFMETAGHHYSTMQLEDICELPINKLANDETVLFLWATNPLLFEALQVLSAWGFQYKTNIAWVKDRGRGVGWFLRSRHELLLIGTRDNTPHPKYRPDSCFIQKRPQRHSQKPNRAYEIIERMYPGKKIELFARTQRDGWEVWGNEIRSLAL